MKSIRIILLLLFCSFHGILEAQKTNPDRPWFFIQITDPQFGMFEGNVAFEKETDLYGKAVTGINRLKPDFVVITGDFVHDKNNRSQIDEFKRITARIDKKIPVYYTPGNHDIGKVDHQNLEIYKKRYGADRFRFKHKGSMFIGLNSSIIKANESPFEQEHFAWLEKNLKKSTGSRHLIIFCHYPFFIRSFDEPETYSNIGIANREKYLSLFTENQVDAVFSGHLHNNAVTSYGKIQMVVTSAVGKPLGEASSGLRIVKVYNDRIDNQYYGLDEVPDALTFE